MDDRTEERLLDILDMVDELAPALAGLDFEQFQRDGMKRRVAERLLEIAGEAATYVPDEVAPGPREDWVGIRKMRIILAHAYGRVNDKMLWEAATVSLPRLGKTIRDAFPDLK